jgi:DNA-binding response OmpR family regulator
VKVLVIDDEAPLRRATARALKGLGFDATHAAPEEFFSANVEEVDAILSDWDMPDGGGARVLEEALVPVVIMTARPETVPAGVEVVSKPAPLHEIEQALRRAIIRARREAENHES